jgi:hypothetical protein
VTVDPFNPPELTLTPASFARRRASLLDEIGRSRLRRPLLLVAVVGLAILIPVTAFAVGHDWWFFRFGDAPAPVTGVVVVKTGVWDGKGWQLTAYRSSTDGLCYGLGPTGTENGEGAMMACGGIAGVPRTPQSKPGSPYAITYGMGSGSRGVLPAFIYGPVTDRADEVVVAFRNGAVLRTPTFAAPSALGAPVRFYAAQLPPSVPPLRIGLPEVLEKLVGLDRDGRIVDCMTLPSRPEGEPLSACDD